MGWPEHQALYHGILRGLCNAEDVRSTALRHILGKAWKLDKAHGINETAARPWTVEFGFEPSDPRDQQTLCHK